MRNFALALGLLCAASTAAAADDVPEALLVRSYAVVNAGEFPEHLVIAYPWICDAGTREPPGIGSPDAEGIHYDVVTQGTEHTSMPTCRESRIYVVDRAGLTVAPRVVDGEPRPVDIAELTALRGEQLAAFFRGDPRVHPTGYVIAAPREVVDERTPLRKIYTMLRLERAGEAFTLRGVRVRYTYDDAGVEDLPYTSREPPPPSGAGLARSVPPAPLRMVSEVPRWPFIVGACGVFVIMALFGLRRRS